MKKVKITQVKSGIDRSERQKQTLIALGLKKLNASKEVEATPQILGMIDKVAHLVKVEEVASSYSISHYFNYIHSSEGRFPESKNQQNEITQFTTCCRFSSQSN